MEEEKKNDEWKNLSVDEKCIHKSWNARVEGYEAAKRLFQSLDDDKSPEWSKYAGLLKKFVVDGNISAQEKGLDTVLAYIKNYVHAGKTVNEVMSNLVQKCIGSSSKPKTKELAMQICLMYIEIEKYEIVVEELFKGTESKNPKTSCGCLTILTEALKEFGPKVVSASKILKKISGPLSDRDKNVRGEARALVVEAYRWIGVVVKQQLSSLKPAQLTELESEFEKVIGPTPTPNRLLRSQQAKKIVQSSNDAADGDGEAVDEEEGENEVYPTEFLESVDVLSKLPKTFFTQLEEKNWTERRDALEILEKELQAAPRLDPVDYGDLIRALKKIISKDSNVVVVASALKCLTGLAVGLKKKFLPYVNALMPTLLEKFKEKKQNVVSALRDCVDAIFLISHLESISEDIVTALDNKNPYIKNEVSLFLGRCFTRCTPAILNKKLLKVLSTVLLKVLNYSDPSARDSAALALGTAMKVVGEKGIAPFLPDVGDQKMAKIKSCCETAQLQKPIKVVTSEAKSEKSSAAPKQATKTQSSRPGTSKAVRPTKKEAPPSKVVRPGGDVSKKLSNKIPAEILNDLNISDGNKRLHAHEELLNHIQSNDISKDLSQPLLETLSALDDENQNVVEVKINCMKAIAKKVDLSGSEMKSILVPLLKKYSDSKYNDCVASCLASFAKSVGADSFAQSILSQNIVSDKNLWANSLKWITEGILNYNLIFNQEFLQREAQKAIKSENLILRQAGCGLIGTLVTMGKDSERNPPRQIQAVASAPKNDEAKKDNKSRDSTPPSKSHTDISTVVTAQTLSELTDKSWKTRYDALERIKPLIENMGNISPNLGEVQNVFEKLLVDKNTKVVQSALMCFAVLIKGLGIHSRKYTNYFLPKVLKNVSDPKAWVRNCVLAVLDAYGLAGGYKKLFDNDILADTCSTITLPAAKSELLTWITQTLNRVDTVAKEGLVALVPVVYQCLEDRNGDVRKASNEVVVTLMMHLGYDAMLNGCSNLKGSTATVVKALLDKNRGSVPEPEPTVMRGKSASQLKKMGPGSSATFTKPSKAVAKLSSERTSKQEEDAGMDGVLLEVNDCKHGRVQNENKLKTLKWNFTTPRPEFVEQLKGQMTSANINPILIANMFHADFKYHIKAIDSLAEDLTKNRDGVISNLDLILRWMTLRFFDTNPSVLIKGLEYVLNVFNVLIEEEYSMLDTEAVSFLPYLSNKAGDPKDTVKNHVRNIFKLTALIYPKQKLFSIMLDGLKSKNARLRAELLELICWMINTYTLDVCTSDVVLSLKEIGKHIGDKDTSVRNGALNCMVAVYYLLGEDLHRHLGTLPDGPLTLLEERLKRAAKNRPVSISSHVASSNDETRVRDDAVKSLQNNLPDNVGTNEMAHLNEESDNNLNTTFNVNSQPHIDNYQQNIHQAPEHHHPSEGNQFAELLEKSLSSGPYRLDAKFYEPLPSFKCPEIQLPDLSWMTLPKRKVAKFTLPHRKPSASIVEDFDDPVIRELTNEDLEKAITAMTKVELTLYSHRAHSMQSKINYLVKQLEQQLIILKHSDHPDLVNCYRGNFALILKFCDNKELCEAINESNLTCLIKQLLLLLTENRLSALGQEMFTETVNIVVIRLIETCNKTVVMGGLIKLLHQTIRESDTQKQYQDLLLKSLWKMNKTQADWDSTLFYPTILGYINDFFVEFPTSYWREQEKDVPMKTIKNILHTMVKLRGKRVSNQLISVPGISHESEIANYIRKVIRHLEASNELPPDNVVDHQPSSSHIGSSGSGLYQADGIQSLQVQNENQALLQILQQFINSNENPEALKHLYDFKDDNPDIDLDLYLIKLPLPAIIYIKRGLVSLKFRANSNMASVPPLDLPSVHRQ